MLRLELLAHKFRREPSNPFELPVEIRIIAEPYLIADLHQAQIGLYQQLRGSRYPALGDVFRERAPRCAFKKPAERRLIHVNQLCQRFEVNFLVKRTLKLPTENIDPLLLVGPAHRKGVPRRQPFGATSLGKIAQNRQKQRHAPRRWQRNQPD